MTATVIPFRRTDSPQVLEGLLLGALLDLPDKLQLLDAMGLGRDDFLDLRVAIAVTVVKRLAERKLEVNASTVVSAAKTARMLGDEHHEWLLGLASGNGLTRESALQLAQDLRMRSRGRRVLVDLKREVETIEAGRFHAARVAGVLDTIARQLSQEFSPDESAEESLLTMLAAWDEHEKGGTSALLPTGLKILDEQIGGLPPRLCFLAGEPGTGKTAVLGSMLRAMLEGSSLKPTDKLGLFGLEDGDEWLSKRWVAEGTGMLLREVGWKPRTPELHEKLAATNERIFPLLKRVLSYRRDSITADQMMLVAASWVFHHGVRAIFVDHMGEVDHRDRARRDEHWQAVGETVRRMRNFAMRYAVPVVVLVHTTTDGLARGEGPPAMNGLEGGRSLDRKARLVLGLWSKKQTLRCTVLKGNELGPKGTTVEFERLYDAGLITADGGRVVDLQSEAAEERRNKQAASDAEGDRRSIARAERRAALKPPKEPKPAAKPKEPPPQAELLAVPESAKPDRGGIE